MGGASGYDGGDVSLRRKYEALRSRAADQAGTPEGELCARIADRLQRVHDLDDEAVGEIVRREFRWKTEADHQLLIRVCDYLGAVPMVYTNRPRVKVVIVDADAVTGDLVDHAYESMRGKLDELLVYTTAGFLQGAMPIQSKGDGDSGSKPDAALLEAAMAGAHFGARSRPVKALTEAD